MTCSEPTTGITVYGCAADEAALFHELAPRFGVLPTITEAAVTEANVDLALGDRCISVGHQTRVTNPTLRALSDAGVRYLSTRSIGTNHIDVRYAESVGIRVEGVTYSPDSVADYTLMLMLMAVRHAKSVICRADTHDYRLPRRTRQGAARPHRRSRRHRTHRQPRCWTGCRGSAAGY